MKKDLLAYFALGVVCILWGTTYLAIRMAVAHFPPFLFMAIRQTIAGSILAGFMLLTGKSAWPSKQEILIQAIAGFFLISVGNGFLAWAETYIPSGVAAILCSLMPMVIILVNLTINREEKPTIPIIMGVLIGLSGITMIFGQHIKEFSQAGYFLGIVLTFVSVVSWAFASVWLKKRKSNSSAFLTAGLQLFFGGLWLFPASFIVEDVRSATWSPEVLYPMIYLIVFGSIVAFACYTYALRKLPMTILSLHAYINPIVAVILGWMVLNETLNLRIWGAMLITLVGVYIVNRGYQLRDLWRAQFTR